MVNASNSKLRLTDTNIINNGTSDCHTKLLSNMSIERPYVDTKIPCYELDMEEFSKTYNYFCVYIVGFDCYAGLIEKVDGSIEVYWNYYDYDSKKNDSTINMFNNNRKLIINNTRLLLKALNEGDKFRCLMHNDASMEAVLTKKNNDYSIEYKYIEFTP